MTVINPAKYCPFCGVVTDVPHEKQQVCINALHEEIARMRNILGQVKRTAESLAPEGSHEAV